MTIFKNPLVHEKKFLGDIENPALLYTIWNPNQPDKFTHVYGESGESKMENYDFLKKVRSSTFPGALMTKSEISAEPPPFMPMENICRHCGAISFFPIEICGICRKKAASSLEKNSMTISENKKKRCLTFDQFEETKVLMNRLNRELTRTEFIEPPPPERAKLQAEIDRLDKLLEDNIHLALLFDSKFFLGESDEKENDE